MAVFGGTKQIRTLHLVEGGSQTSLLIFTDHQIGIHPLRRVVTFLVFLFLLGCDIRTLSDFGGRYTH